MTTKVILKKASEYLFEIPLANRNKVYMTSNLSYNPYIIIVNAIKFLELLQNSGEKLALDTSSWHKDYKYLYAEKGFLHGKVSPVPLANVSAYRKEHYFISSYSILGSPYRAFLKEGNILPRTLKLLTRENKIYSEYFDVAEFIDGTTRTIWLLNNKANSFPISCDEDSLSILLKVKQDKTKLICL